jgi:hypothetical protein
MIFFRILFFNVICLQHNVNPVFNGKVSDGGQQI